jgi:hypothetical protein
MYQLTNLNGVRRLSDGAYIPADPDNRDYARYLRWVDAGNTPMPVPVPPTPTQRELDERRYKRRAAVKDELIAFMAADNMSRVRAGQWTVADLTGLMADPALQAANAYMATLSYELAAQAIGQATNPLMTPAIKSAWVAKLQEHFYLVP